MLKGSEASVRPTQIRRQEFTGAPTAVDLCQTRQLVDLGPYSALTVMGLYARKNGQPATRVEIWRSHTAPILILSRASYFLQ